MLTNADNPRSEEQPNSSSATGTVKPPVHAAAPAKQAPAPLPGEGRESAESSPVPWDFDLPDAPYRLGHHPHTTHTKDILDEYLKLLNSWNWKIDGVRITQLVLTVVAIVASTLVTLTATDKDPVWEHVRFVASFLAAVTVGLLYGAGIGAKADRWRDAWRRLSLAHSLREAEKISDADLICARHAAERLIGGVVVNIGQADTRPEKPQSTRQPA